MTNSELFAIEVDMREGPTYDIYTTYFRCSSHITCFKGNWHKSREEAVIDGNNHINAIKNLIHNTEKK
jgi:hypothetical protein